MKSTKPDKRYKLSIKLEGNAPGMNQIRAKGWRYRHGQTTKWKEKIKEAVRGKTPKKPIKACRLRLTRFCSRTMDWDNCLSSFKALIDGLVNCKILEDDKVANIPICPEVYQVKVPRKEAAMMIELEEITLEQ